MDDLVAHFGGLSPLELYPHAARTSILVPLHAQTNAPPVESSLIPHITATPDGYIESHAVLSSPSASAQPSTGTSPSFPLGYDSTADLTPLRELLLRRTATPPARSNDIVTESMPKMDNDAESGYILHFRDKDVASQNSTPTPRPPRNLLNDLVASNTDSASVEDRTPSEPNDSISRRGSNYDQEPLRSGDLSVTDEDSSTLEQHYQELAFQEQHAPSKERQGEGIDYTPEASGISGVTHGHTPGGAKSSPDGTDFEQGNDVHQILRRWHQQDMERDRLLNVSHDCKRLELRQYPDFKQGLREEIQDLKRALQAEARRPRATYMSSNWHDNNRRAEAAERTLMEAQQDMVS